MASNEQWISKQEAAQRLGFSEKTIDRRRRSRELASFKSTDLQQGHVRISVASLEAYLARRQGLQADATASPPPKSLPIPALEKIRAAKAAGRSASGRPALTRVGEAA
jgi:helix-turn-helix protein